MSEVFCYSYSNHPTSSFSCFDSLIGTHVKVCIEKPSWEELNTKVVELNITCPIEQVFVHEKDMGKKNNFGLVQDNIHNKKSNKADVDLTPMSKETWCDVIPLLHKST